MDENVLYAKYIQLEMYIFELNPVQRNTVPISKWKLGYRPFNVSDVDDNINIFAHKLFINGQFSLELYSRFAR